MASDADSLSVILVLTGADSSYRFFLDVFLFCFFRVFLDVFFFCFSCVLLGFILGFFGGEPVDPTSLT